jgi:hypothetical protein
MTQYKKNLVEGLALPTNVTLPGTNKLMDRNDDSPLLNDEARTFFHQYVAKVLYLATHMHGELSFYVNILAQRTANPTTQDLQHLTSLLGYIKDNVHETLTLDASHYSHPVVYIDASYAVNRDYKSQAGACMFFGTSGKIFRTNRDRILGKTRAIQASSEYQQALLHSTHHEGL